jgi:putative tricarboxylic transport membrane protein
MVETRTKGVLVGVLMLAAGLGYLYLTASLPRRGGAGAAVVDASFIPYILAFMMVGLGLLQLVVSLRRPSEATPERFDPEAEADTGAPSYGTVLLTLALVAGFTAALRPLGFPVAAAIYLFLQFIVLRPADRNFGYPVYALIAVVASVVIFVGFRYGFQLLLPAGPLTPYLP